MVHRVDAARGSRASQWAKSPADFDLTGLDDLDHFLAPIYSCHSLSSFLSQFRPGGIRALFYLLAFFDPIPHFSTHWRHLLRCRCFTLSC